MSNRMIVIGTGPIGGIIGGRLARADGSGLGLAIVSRIVADHRGLFALESETGKGTIARVYLPIAGD